MSSLHYLDVIKQPCSLSPEHPPLNLNKRIKTHPLHRVTSDTDLSYVSLVGPVLSLPPLLWGDFIIKPARCVVSPPSRHCSFIGNAKSACALSPDSPTLDSFFARAGQEGNNYPPFWEFANFRITTLAKKIHCPINKVAFVGPLDEEIKAQVTPRRLAWWWKCYRNVSVKCEKNWGDINI